MGKGVLVKNVAILFVLLWASAAGAVPKTINFTGRLSTASGPVDGAVNLTLKLYAEPDDGTALWTEVHNNVGADEGLVFLDIGTLTTLDETILDGRRLYLEIVVGSETLAPRLAFNAVPYAVRTEVAATADLLGTIAPGDVITSVAGNAGVAAARSGNTVMLGLSTTGCSNGQVYKFNGSTFACANDANTTFTAGNGINVSGTTIALSTTGCATGSVWKFNGTNFACAPDAGTNFTAGNGLDINGTTIALSTTGCATGSVWKFNGTTFTCQPDANTTFTAGAGVSIASGTIGLSTTGCASGSVWKFNGTTFTCQPDANTTFTAGAGVSISGGAIGLSTTGCANGSVWKFNGTTFTCQPDANTTFTASAPVSISGNNVSLAGCGANQVLRWNGTAWACGPAFTAGTCTWKVTVGTASATTQTATCPVGKHPISGGCDPAGSTTAVTSSRPFGPPTDGDTASTVTQWFCEFSAPAANHVAYALCCDTI
jgi:hypothetical protein